ncbi:MAG: hypothetical protein Q9191_001134 [Dirinaria sp. TL-2023a]
MAQIMEIDDTFATLNDDSLPQGMRDLQELTRAWVTERSAPEILQWPVALMDRVLEGIRRQIELVEEQTGTTDPKANFRLIIIQTELERFKFLVRSFLRTRMAKIDAHALHYLLTSSAMSRLSPSELQYARKHQSLLQQHYQSSFLAQFPSSLQSLDDTNGGISMIETPDADRAVFTRALRDTDEPIYVEGTDTYFEMKRGDVFVVRWSAVKTLVEEGAAELI